MAWNDPIREIYPIQTLEWQRSRQILVTLQAWISEKSHFYHEYASKLAQNRFKISKALQKSKIAPDIKHSKMDPLELQKGFKMTSNGFKSSQVLLNEEIWARSLHLARLGLIWSRLKSLWSLFEVRLVLRGTSPGGSPRGTPWSFKKASKGLQTAPNQARSC